jgi:hypothetical protein
MWGTVLSVKKTYVFEGILLLLEINKKLWLMVVMVREKGMTPQEQE